MRNLLVVVTVLVAFVVYSQQQEAKPKCFPDHVFTTCGTACPEACDSDPCRVCTRQCVIGCQCRDGFVKASSKSSICVPKKDCPRCLKHC
ncbi:chymotrypsin inhibitor [Cephus cinctus]|uniref:Chymotrypsin inhibitor n=1 Tax=Cephus cinctus TaxID=211228 RepID=A0AAJ7FH97_CEPCN|nr:chymotrypsin inhibitor [Cephus cinctus]